MVKKREIKITSSSQENPSADNELLEQQSGFSTSVPNPTTDWFNVSVSFKNKNFKVSIDYRSIQHRFSPWLVEISPSILICRTWFIYTKQKCPVITFAISLILLKYWNISLLFFINDLLPYTLFFFISNSL